MVQGLWLLQDMWPRTISQDLLASWTSSEGVVDLMLRGRRHWWPQGRAAEVAEKSQADDLTDEITKNQLHFTVC
jgi:hypothetical protein